MSDFEWCVFFSILLGISIRLMNVDDGVSIVNLFWIHSNALDVAVAV